MTEHIQMPVGNYGTVNVEIYPSEEYEDDDSREKLSYTPGEKPDTKIDKTTGKLKDAFEKMSGTIHTLACGFRERIDQLDAKVRPDEVSVEFGLSLKVGTGVVVAQAGTEANFKICMKWKSSDSPELSEKVTAT